jgi:type IV fimbrial biogenesis protein FimT
MKKTYINTEQSGFTLLECMVACTVAAVLAMVAVTGAERWSQSTMLRSLATTLSAGLHVARSEAFKRNGRVVVCRSEDGNTCAPSGTWDRGWIVFHDRNGNGVREAAEPIIHAERAAPSGYRVKGNQSVAAYVSYLAEGQTKLVTGAFQAGTITVCKLALGPTEAHQIVISATGRPRIQKTTVSACV